MLQAGDLLVAHDARVEVGQQARLLDHADRHRAQVVERRVEAALVEPVAGDRVAVLGPVAEREERLRSPAPAPVRAIETTSSGVRNGASSFAGAFANTQ